MSSRRWVSVATAAGGGRVAYSVKTLKSAYKDVQGRVHVCWTIVQEGVDSDQEWTLTGLPPFFTITLFEAYCTTEIRPGLGLASGWTANTLNDVGLNHAFTTWVRNEDSIRVTTPTGVLFGRNNNSAGGSLTITTRITYVEGH